MEPLETTVPAAAEAPHRSVGRGLRRTIATLFLATGLLAIGGVAAVSAASPAPSSSTAPSTPGGSGTHTGTPGANCPGM